MKRLLGLIVLLEVLAPMIEACRGLRNLIDRRKGRARKVEVGCLVR